MSKPQTFTFPGLWPYIERAAEGRNRVFLGRGRELWHAKQVQDALGQAPKLDPENRRALLAHVAAVRDSLAATLDGVDLAVRETIKSLEETPAVPELDAVEVALQLAPGPAVKSTVRRDRRS